MVCIHVFLFNIRSTRASSSPKVDAAEDFYQEALEELDRKPYPSLEGIRIVNKVDTIWLKKLDGKGFFEKVYGGKF